MKLQCNTVIFMKQLIALSRIFVIVKTNHLEDLLWFLEAISNKSYLSLSKDHDQKLSEHAFDVHDYGNPSRFSSSQRTCVLTLIWKLNGILQNGSWRLDMESTQMSWGQ